MVALKVRAAGLLSVAALSWLGLGSAQAQVSQLDGTVLPTPTLPGETAVVTSRGFPADAGTLQGLFKYRGEMLDPITSARTTPGTFSPTCGFSGELLLRGGSCKVAFGWYNAADPSQIFELVPADTSAAFMCQDNDFCPLATMDTTQVGQHTWTPKAFSADDIKADVRYTGGQIGFALIGDQSTQCKQTKYSELERNTVSTTYGEPWVTTLVYQSTANPEGFYLAFEDLAMSPESWTNAGPGSPSNDGDFNDFVYFINGLSCTGGGLPCDVPGVFGACSVGRTECSAGDAPGTCRPIVTAGPERCDNVDNDCNGIADDGDGLCTVAGQVCDKGQCVDACGTGEFRCDPGFTCKAGHCIDDACAAIDCMMGQRCDAGTCKEACADVVCPLGSECQLGRCVDPCKEVVCPTGRVCERGLCVSNCQCRGCTGELECQADGRCLDAACVGVQCSADQQCVAGACVDLCPPGQTIVDGACVGPGTGGSGNGTGADGPITLGGSVNGGGASSSGGANGAGPVRQGVDPGCACAVVGGSPSNVGGLLLAGFGLAFWLGRRRAGAA